MKRILAGTGMLWLVCALWVTVFSPGAHSQPLSEVFLTQSTWYWQQQVSGVAVPGSPPQTVPDPTVPSGDLAVSGPEQQGHATAEAYLEFDVSAIPSGSTITSFKVSLPVDSSASNLVPAGTIPPIIACVPQEIWTGDPGPQPYSQKPTDHCDTSAPKVTSNDGGKTYSVDIASIASGWVTDGAQNFGVAINDDQSNTSTAYQVVFGPASAISNLHATVDFTPPSSDNGLSGTAGGIPAAGSTAAPPSAAGSAPSGASASSAGLPATAVAIPPETAAAPQPASTIPSRGGTTRTSPAATGYAAATSTPPAGFWMVGAVLAVLIAVCMLELRRNPTNAAAGGERGVGRLLSRLAAQQGSGPPGGAGPTIRPATRRPGDEKLA